MHTAFIRILNINISVYIPTTINLEKMKRKSIGGYYSEILNGHYIAINEKYIDLFKADPTETAYILADILAHEMIHQVCNIDGIEDMDETKNIHFHSIAFKEQAEKHGLLTSNEEYLEYGYIGTQLPKEMYFDLLQDKAVQSVLIQYAPIETYSDI